MAESMLDTVYLHVTERCRNNCVYCYMQGSGAKQQTGLNSETWVDIHSKIQKMKPRKVVVTGGEPMLRGDILSLLRGFRKNDPHHGTTLALNTCGINMTPQTAIALVGLPDRVRVSIDGPEHINDMIRGRGSHRTAMTSIVNLMKAGFEPEAGITVTRFNIDAVPNFAVELRETGVRHISINLVRNIGGAAGGKLQPSKEEFRETVKKAEKMLGLPHEEEKPTAATCGVGRYLSVTPLGTVYPCHVLSLPGFELGNLTHTSLKEILSENGLLERLRNLDPGGMAAIHPELRELASGDFCLGQVYRGTQNCSVWAEELFPKV